MLMGTPAFGAPYPGSPEVVTGGRGRSLVWAMEISLNRRALAEFVGTFWLVLCGCGSAVLAAAYPGLGIGFAGVAFAFGLSLLTVAFAIGHISGCHVNPAVTVGLVLGGRFPSRDLPVYLAAQVLGGIAAGALLLVISQGSQIFNVGLGFATNGYGPRSPGGFSLYAGLITELVFTFMFVFVIMGATDLKAPRGFAPVAIGLCLTVIHLVTIPVTNTSVNPARSTGVAIFARHGAVAQLWLFWVAPLIGGALGGIAYRALVPARPVVPREVAQPEAVIGPEPVESPA
jgi:aquaporin Z